MRVRSLITLCLVLSACESVTEPRSAVRSVTLDPPSLSMLAGTTQQLTATPRDVNLEPVPDATIEWSTSNASVATVSDDGDVTATGKGNATIIATSGGRTAVASVSVRMAVAQLTLSTASLPLIPGQAQSLVVSAVDVHNNVVVGATVTWASSAPNVATVTGLGMTAIVTGMNPGTATISVSADGKAVAAFVLVDIPVVVHGEWDWLEQITDGVSNTVCTDTGSVALTQSGSTLTGSWEQTGACALGGNRLINTKSASLIDGSTGVNSVTFITVAGAAYCLYNGTVNVERTAIAGTVFCGSYRGTWQATRALPIATVSIVAPPGVADALRGETHVLSAHLTNSAGRRAFRRGLTWSSTNIQVATITQALNPQVATFRAVGDGNATIRAVIEAASAGVPTTVRSVNLTSVAAGAEATCGSDALGTVFCWGLMPRRSFANTQLVSLSLGARKGCGLDIAGLVYCWLDTEALSGTHTPVPMVTSLRFTKLSVGGWFSLDYYYYYYYTLTPRPHVCATTADGTAYCWGDDTHGQLGDGIAGDVTASPIAVATPLRFSSIAAGGRHTCALTAAGRAHCWGANWDGQLGNGTTVDSPVPVEIASSVDFASIYAGGQHTCALTAAGAAWCWGGNGNGALGIPDVERRAEPTMAMGGLTFTALALGEHHTCGITTGGDVYCWGANYEGQAGLGGGVTRAFTPQRILGTLKFTSVTTAPGARHTCGFATDQRAYCWGSLAQLGAGASSVAGPNLVLGQR